MTYVLTRRRGGRGLGALPTDSEAFFDPAAEFIRAKQAYESKMGSMQSTKFANLAYPKTTWAQVAAFYAAWLDYIDPAKCYARLPPGLYTGDECIPTKDSAYLQAERDFAAAAPLSKVSTSELVDKITAGGTYPYNEDFWGYGRAFSLQLSSSVNLPTKFDMAIESIGEALTELPANVRDALAKVDPSKWLPGASFFENIVKWSLVGVGLYGVYYFWKQRRQ